MVAASLFLASLLVAAATAQEASTTVSQSMPPAATSSFNPGLVSQDDAFAWCHAQLNTCPQICNGTISANACSQTAFTYTCICANGVEPDCTAYQQTLPFYICQATYQQCINAHPNDAQAQSTCTTNEQCGTKNATAQLVAYSSMLTSTPTSTSSAAASSTAAASKTSATAAATSTGAAAFISNEHVTTGIFAAALMAAFKLLL